MVSISQLSINYIALITSAFLNWFVPNLDNCIYILDYLNKNDFISIFKALIGAIYNWSGAVGASRIMKKFELLSDECIFAYDNDIKTKFKQYEPYLKINDLFTWIEFNEPFDIDFPAKLINELTDYRFKNQHILLVALTHKSKSIYNNASIWDNNQIPYSTLSCPTLNDRHFAKLGRETRQRWFLF